MEEWGFPPPGYIADFTLTVGLGVGVAAMIGIAAAKLGSRMKRAVQDTLVIAKAWLIYGLIGNAMIT